MTSSTSSSDQRINHTHPDDPRRNQARRTVAVKTILLGGSAMLVALMIVNLGVSLLRETFPNPFSIQRIETAGDALGAALEIPDDDPREIVYVLGSSLVQFGFSPDIFDQAMARRGTPTISFNYGFGNADPSIHEKFALKLARTFAAQPEKIDRIIYEFSPFQATQQRAKSTGQLDHAATAALMNAEDFTEILLEDHDEAIALLNTHYLREGVPAEAITNMLALPIKNAGLVEASLSAEAPEPLEGRGWQLYNQLKEEWPQASPPGGWIDKHRGGLPPSASPEAMALAEEVMQVMQDPYRMEAARKQRIACCDMLDLHIDDQMLAHFIQAIKYAQSVSKKVDLLLMPRNQDVIQLSETGYQNLQAALQRIQQETGINIIDLSVDPYFPVQDFFDADHLTIFKGREKVSRLLADTLQAEQDTPEIPERPSQLAAE